jgi:translation initiation factor IF-3
MISSHYSRRLVIAALQQSQSRYHSRSAVFFSSHSGGAFCFAFPRTRLNAAIKLKNAWPLKNLRSGVSFVQTQSFSGRTKGEPEDSPEFQQLSQFDIADDDDDDEYDDGRNAPGSLKKRGKIPNPDIREQDVQDPKYEDSLIDKSPYDSKENYARGIEKQFREIDTEKLLQTKKIRDTKVIEKMALPLREIDEDVRHHGPRIFIPPVKPGTEFQMDFSKATPDLPDDSVLEITHKHEDSGEEKEEARDANDETGAGSEGESEDEDEEEQTPRKSRFQRYRKESELVINLTANEDIRHPLLRVNYLDKATEKRISEIMGRGEALSLAKSMKLDLILLNENLDPPVCRVASKADIIHDLKTKKKEGEKARKLQIPKEIQMKQGIDQHDFGIKLGQARKFILDGQNVKIIIISKSERVNYTLTRSQREELENHPDNRLRNMFHMANLVKEKMKGLPCTVSIVDNYIMKFIPSPTQKPTTQKVKPEDREGHVERILNTKEIMISVTRAVAEEKKKDEKKKEERKEKKKDKKDKKDKKEKAEKES